MLAKFMGRLDMISKRKLFLLPFLILIIAILACGNEIPVTTEDVDITDQFTTPTETIVSSSPTFKKPEQTPTPQYTSTPSPLGYAAVTANLCNLRSGPGTDYSIVGSGEKDDVYPVFGKSQDGSWLWVDRTQPIWISTSLVELDVDISEISIVNNIVVGINEVANTSTYVVSVTSEIRVDTKTPTPTPIPETAGLSNWMVDDGRYLGVREISWDKYLGYYRPEKGQIFLSIYIISINNSNREFTFSPSDINLVDGGGEIHGRVVFGDKEPTFSSCTVKPGGICEGWWTTMIWDRPEVRENLFIRWNPCWLFCDTQEVPVIQ